MKQIIAIIACMLAFSPAFAQFPEVKVEPKLALVKEKGKVVNVISYLPQKKHMRKSAIGGRFTTVRKQPVKGIKTFIYMPDSSIISSGYTTATGDYETGNVAPGNYSLKITYPNTKAETWVTGVPVLAGYITEVSFMKSEIPTADTAIEYKDIAPRVPEKKKKF
ncbi:MAG: carboxypeptidase-like regulatory domain-containing protein [Bacteroidota bacterium]